MLVRGTQHTASTVPHGEGAAHRIHAGFGEDLWWATLVHTNVILRQGPLIKSPAEWLTQDPQDDLSPSNSEEET
jgi:hypothetical protein